jgi:hypothetical protein
VQACDIDDLAKLRRLLGYIRANRTRGVHMDVPSGFLVLSEFNHRNWKKLKNHRAFLLSSGLQIITSWLPWTSNCRSIRCKIEADPEYFSFTVEFIDALASSKRKVKHWIDEIDLILIFYSQGREASYRKLWAYFRECRWQQIQGSSQHPHKVLSNTSLQYILLMLGRCLDWNAMNSSAPDDRCRKPK